MSEGWAIAILAGALSIMTLVLGWIATEIRAIREDLQTFVLKEDCSSAMDGHCIEIRNLWAETRKQGERIAHLEK